MNNTDIFTAQIEKQTGCKVHYISYFGYIDHRNLFNVVYGISETRRPEAWDCELVRDYRTDEWYPVCTRVPEWD